VVLAAGLVLAGQVWSHAEPTRSKRSKRTVVPTVQEPQPVVPTTTGRAPRLDLNAAVPALPPDLQELPLAARGAIVVDELTGRTLYEKNADAPQYPASTTKMMTALLVIEEGDLDREIEVSVEDSRVGESGLDIQPGQRYTRREALYGLMLKSANDVASSLGRDNAGSVAAFAEKMTLRARELGATNTRFMNPHGLHHVQHFTTPRDLAIIARAAMQQPHFRKISGSQFSTWTTGAYGPRQLRNHNRMLWNFPGCTGGKTGYTFPSQQVLTCAAQWGTQAAVSVIMHSDKPGIWNDTKLLLTYGLQQLRGGATLPATTVVEQ
jgi:D-alanyl-D-alanine carboxypeptidase (penicillin-binding protein 5/6)